MIRLINISNLKIKRELVDEWHLNSDENTITVDFVKGGPGLEIKFNSRLDAKKAFHAIKNNNYEWPQ